MKRNIFLSLVFLVAAIPSFLFAETKSVVINEIAWMGSSVAGVDAKQWWRYEWLELYNNVDTVGMLDGWMLELYRDTLDFGIPLRGAISPRGYFLIGASDKIQGLDLNYKNLAGKFNNSGQRVLLKNGAGEIVDEIDATKGWPAGDNESKSTMERLQGSEPCIQGSEPCIKWHISADSGGTPKAQNSSGVALKPSFNNEKLGFSSETKKDLRGSSPRPEGRAAFFIAFPGAVLVGALVLAARKFLYKA